MAAGARLLILLDGEHCVSQIIVLQGYMRAAHGATSSNTGHHELARSWRLNQVHAAPQPTRQHFVPTLVSWHALWTSRSSSREPYSHVCHSIGLSLASRTPAASQRALAPTTFHPMKQSALASTCAGSKEQQAHACGRRHAAAAAASQTARDTGALHHSVPPPYDSAGSAARAWPEGSYVAATTQPAVRKRRQSESHARPQSLRRKKGSNRGMGQGTTPSAVSTGGKSVLRKITRTPREAPAQPWTNPLVATQLVRSQPGAAQFARANKRAPPPSSTVRRESAWAQLFAHDFEQEDVLHRDGDAQDAIQPGHGTVDAPADPRPAGAADPELARVDLWQAQPELPAGAAPREAAVEPATGEMFVPAPEPGQAGEASVAEQQQAQPREPGNVQASRQMQAQSAGSLVDSVFHSAMAQADDGASSMFDSTASDAAGAGLGAHRSSAQPRPADAGDTPARPAGAHGDAMHGSDAEDSVDALPEIGRAPRGDDQGASAITDSNACRACSADRCNLCYVS
jgi:hypothetical protein